MGSFNFVIQSLNQSSQHVLIVCTCSMEMVAYFNMESRLGVKFHVHE